MILIIIRDSFFKFIQLTLVKLNVINDLTLCSNKLCDNQFAWQ